jgi:hypothetical protein
LVIECYRRQQQLWAMQLARIYEAFLAASDDFPCEIGD